MILILCHFFSNSMLYDLRFLKIAISIKLIACEVFFQSLLKIIKKYSFMSHIHLKEDSRKKPHFSNIYARSFKIEKMNMYRIKFYNYEN